ncbi:hypothetical protein STEG23_024475 [Scotinomys teguina]
MQPGQTTNTGGGTMEVVAAALRCQLLLIVLMAAMLLPGKKGSPLLVQRKIAGTIKLQESISKEKECNKINSFVPCKVIDSMFVDRKKFNMDLENTIIQRMQGLFSGCLKDAK